MVKTHDGKIIKNTFILTKRMNKNNGNLDIKFKYEYVHTHSGDKKWKII